MIHVQGYYTAKTMFSLYIGRVPVPDERYDWLCAHWKPPSTIPAYLSVVDIAGLVKGAHEGQVSACMCVSDCEYVYLYACKLGVGGG